MNSPVSHGRRSCAVHVEETHPLSRWLDRSLGQYLIFVIRERPEFQVNPGELSGPHVPIGGCFRIKIIGQHTARDGNPMPILRSNQVLDSWVITDDRGGGPNAGWLPQRLHPQKRVLVPFVP